MENPIIITKRNVDGQGNPVSIKLMETRQIFQTGAFIVLKQVPDEYYGVQIQGYKEIFDIEKMKNHEFKVDYAQGVIYFHPKAVGKTVVIDYYGTGYDLISCSRIFTKYDKYGNVVETLEEVLDKIYEVEPIINRLTKSEELIDQIHVDLEDAKELQPLLHNDVIQGRQTKEELEQTISSAQDDISTIKATGNDVKYITKNQWVLNSTSGMYEYTLPHTMNSKALTINCYYTDTDEFAFIGGKILDKNNILFKNEEAINLTIVLNSRYYKPQVTLTSEIAEEVVEARKGKVDLKTKIDEVDNELVKVNEELDSIEYHISNFPRIGGEALDRDRIERALQKIPPFGTLIIDEDLDVAKIITITKPITIKGKGKPLYNEETKNFISGSGTIIKNIELRTTSSNVKIYDCAIDGLGIFSNGFMANLNEIKHLYFERVAFRGNAHAVLLESYNGRVTDCVFKECNSYDGTHGFITKSDNTKFINCVAMNHAFQGFGIISDNIPSETSLGLAYDITLDNCKAINCISGFKLYAREMFDDNEDRIYLKNIDFNNCIAENCNTSFEIGENKLYSGALKIITLDKVNFNNCKDIDSRENDGIKIYNISNSKLDFYLNNIITIDKVLCKNNTYNFKSDKDVDYKNIQIISSNSNMIEPILNYNNDTIVIVKNTQETVLNRLGNVCSSIATTLNTCIYLKLEDDVTTISGSGGLLLKNGNLTKNGSWVYLKKQETYWEEIFGFRIP